MTKQMVLGVSLLPEGTANTKLKRTLAPCDMQRAGSQGGLGAGPLEARRRRRGHGFSGPQGVTSLRLGSRRWLR